MYIFFSGRNQAIEQDVQLTNDHKVVSTYNNPKMALASKPVDQCKFIKQHTQNIPVNHFQNVQKHDKPFTCHGYFFW